MDKTIYEGYIVLPCFKVETDDDSTYGYGDDLRLVCGPVLTWIFTHIFAVFWDGTVVITGERRGDAEVH